MGPRRHSKSDGVALGIGGDGDDDDLRKICEDDEAVKERERKMANLTETEGFPISPPSIDFPSSVLATTVVCLCHVTKMQT